MDRFLTVQRGAATALDSVKFPHCDYADGIVLTSNTAENLQLVKLNKFYDYTRFKELNLNTDKTKVVVSISSGNSTNPTFTYDSTPPELVIEFKHLGITLTRDGRMLTAAEKMADNFRSAAATSMAITTGRVVGDDGQPSFTGNYGDKRAGLITCCCLRLCTNLCVRLRCGIRVLLIMRL